MNILKFQKLLFCFSISLYSFMAYPADIRIMKAGSAESSIDLSALKCPSDEVSTIFRKTLENDLNRSGYFRVVAGKAEFVMVGEVEAGGKINVHCEVYNTASRENVFSKGYRETPQEARSLAHKVVDDLIFKITGRPGIASTKILFVSNRTGIKELYLCDADGANITQLTKDNTISVMPKWAPDGKRFIYTSFKSQYPDVYIVNLETGRRECIADFPGLNSSAAMSPNGREIALILSKDGNPELYIMQYPSGKLMRLTRTKATEASPSWSPDGTKIVFVSDRAGAPQLYVVSREGGEPRRLTSTGSQNVDPDWGANGYIAYASLIGRQFQIMVMNPETMQYKQVTPDDASYEDPSWAPDGRHIVCPRVQNYSSKIFIVDTLSETRIPLLPDSFKGDCCAPAWSSE
jgi:TolB protein